MAAKEKNRIFVGGLSPDVTERELEHAFNRYGKILECQIMMERDTGRRRGFGFITFEDRRGMEDAIKEMHGQEIDDHIISVNKAKPRPNPRPKMGGDDYADQGYSATRVGYGRGDRVGQDDCFKCGRKGHSARDCPRFRGERDQYADDRRYGDSYHYMSHRYPTNGDRFASDWYGGGGSDYRYGTERGYDWYNGPRGGAGRYGSEMAGRDEGRNYRGRPGPYDRPSWGGGRPSSFGRY
ncbi:hypothetical protein TanjilG_18310 [Lupinus angustifolius]|uniref:Uncharacterized protein n=1 Tax=Lupinus angustifolius TaxID=3871 RepID=A0A1J7HKG9_LUPAN|nr:PREDICTED: glycine-rich RNA-binding protein RZ1B-like [Lupinus angustifolius]OIW06922.1 hypothetical protein TanjilG_18310 [Lupinus angustifolius]